MESEKKYICPVCGYPDLKSKPYDEFPSALADVFRVEPPYAEHWGTESYEVCSCCGYEFGFDDAPGGDSKGTSFSEYLLKWVRNKEASFFSKDKKPENWNLTEQLSKAGIPVDPKVEWLIKAKKL